MSCPTTAQRRQAAGVCPGCGNERDAAAAYCSPCATVRRAKGRVYQKAKTASLKGAGLCVQCGKAPPETGSVRCSRCADYHREHTAEGARDNRAGRKVAGQCIVCGVECTAARCPACAKKHNAAERIRMPEVYRDRSDKALCVQCGRVPPEETKTLCAGCCSQRNEIVRRRYERRKLNTPGLCKQCNSPVFHAASKCEYHWIYSLVHNYTRGPVPPALIALMANRLHASNSTCAYTGQAIVPGETASIEHIYSRKLFPHLAADPRNMIWVHRQVNWIKQESDPRDPAMLKFLNADIAARVIALAATLDPTPPLK